MLLVLAVLVLLCLLRFGMAPEIGPDEEVPAAVVVPVAVWGVGVGEPAMRIG